MNYLADRNVKTLREIATRMNIPGRSGKAKSDLVALITNAILSDWDNAINLNAPAYDENLVTVHPAAAYMNEVVERNRRRLAGYVSQVGRDKYGRAKFTAKQRRRVMKKAHHAQSVWERLSAQPV